MRTTVEVTVSYVGVYDRIPTVTSLLNVWATPHGFSVTCENVKFIDWDCLIYEFDCPNQYAVFFKLVWGDRTIHYISELLPLSNS